MTTTAAHPMATGGRREYLTGRIIETVAYIVLVAVLVIFNVTTVATDDLATTIINFATIAGMVAVAAIIVSVVLRRRSWQWVVGGSARRRAVEPGWLYWTSLAVETLALAAAFGLLAAWVKTPGLLMLDAGMAYVLVGATAVKVGTSRGRGRIAAGIQALVAIAGAALLSSQMGGIGPAVVAQLVVIGAALSFGIYCIPRAARLMS